jgi:glycosyltransferase involved in cell wall biosynthesis
MSKIAIIFPAHNEESTIKSIISSFHQECPSAEIWVINNASTDNTEAYAASKINELKISGGLINETIKGKGNAVRCAFTHIEADIYVICDADCTYSSSDLNALLDPVRKGEADMVIGDRLTAGKYYLENKRAMHGAGNKLLKFLINYLFKSNLSDTQSGYRVFSRRFVKTYSILVDGFNIETDMTVHALDKRLKILEIQVDYCDRPSGSISKLNTYRDGLLVLKTLSNIFRHYRPLLFFTTSALIFLLLGTFLGYPVIVQHFETGAITRIPLAILSSGIVIISVMLASIGIILDSIAHHDKRMFERELMNFKPLNDLNKNQATNDCK